MHTDFFARRAYQGWYGLPSINEPNAPDSGFEKWTQDVWKKLGEGESLYDALMYAISQQSEFEDPDAPVNSHRYKGQGLIWEMFLTND